jgi:sucrose-6-phosphate hydrolase SacC (GH32 family)
LNAEDANNKLSEIDSGLLHVKMDVEIEHGLGLEVLFRGNTVIDFDGNFNRFNGAPYVSEIPGSFRFSIEILIDKTSLEGYIDRGKLFISQGLKPQKTDDGLQLKGDLKIHSLEVFEMKSVW